MFEKFPTQYDVIFMDIQMPVMDGYDATRHIRAIEAELNKNISENVGLSFAEGKTQSDNGNLRKQIPIIAMTANVFKEDIEKCLEAGMDSHVGKPLDLGEVMNRLHSYLG